MIYLLYCATRKLFVFDVEKEAKMKYRRLDCEEIWDCDILVPCWNCGSKNQKEEKQEPKIVYTITPSNKCVHELTADDIPP